MNEIRQIIRETVNRIMKDLCTKEIILKAERGVWAKELWQTLTEAGMTSIGVPEKQGGVGGTYGDAFVLLRIAGKYAAPVPLAETLLANWLLADAGMNVTETMEFPLTVAPVSSNDRIRFTKESGGWQLAGTARRIPWARHASHIVVVGHSEQGPVVALVNPKSCMIEPEQNLAGEPRDNVDFTGVRLDPAAVHSVGAQVDEASLFTHGALARAVMIAGALERILELSVTYAKERTQFGRPIGRFQAIQQQLAILAGETIAAGTAVDTAVEAFTSGGPYLQTVMMAKIRVNQAVGTGVPIAHQVHGAIGFTEEHALHLSTRRLWAWREEFGTESEWADRLGEKILQMEAKALWPTITSSR